METKENRKFYSGEFVTILEATKINEGTLTFNDKGTLLDSSEAEDRKLPSVSQLPSIPIRLSREDRSESAQAFELEWKEVLSQGGMGRIQLANQLPLYREVAVKRVLPNHLKNHALEASLIREACVTGALEHPYITPVYSLRQDEAQQPIV